MGETLLFLAAAAAAVGATWLARLVVGRRMPDRHLLEPHWRPDTEQFALIAGGERWRRGPGLNSWGQPARGDSFARIAGGERRAVMVAFARLWAAGALRSEVLRALPGPEPAVMTPLERAVHTAVGEVVPADLWLARDVRSALRDLRAPLVENGWLLSRGRVTAMHVLGLLPLVALAVAAAGSVTRTIVAGVAFVAGVLVLHGARRRTGEAAFELAGERERRAGERASALGVALFGVVAVWDFVPQFGVSARLRDPERRSPQPTADPGPDDVDYGWSHTHDL